MADLIDRQKLLKKKQYSFQTEYGAFPRHDYFIKISDIRSMSAVDMQRHAHWEQPSYFDEENGVFQCSNCKEEFVLISGSPKENEYEYEYCPHCGCKMDEVTDKDMEEKE